MKTKAVRQSWVDFARGVAIILVLFRHVFNGIKDSGLSVTNYIYLEHLNIIFYSFRMPLFFIVSGIFLSASFAKRGLYKYIDNKSRTILYPYFVWGVLQITLQVLFANFTNGDRKPFDYLYLLYQPRSIGQFWYLYTLFNVSVLYVITKYVFKFPLWLQISLGLILYFTAALLHVQKINLGFVLDIFNYYMYIAVGDLVHKIMINPQNIKKFQSWKYSLGLLVPFIFLQGFFLFKNLQHPDVFEYRYVEYFMPGLFLLISLTGCAFIISVCFILQRYHYPVWLKILGRNSLYIYVAHVIVFASVRIFLMKVIGITNVPILFITGIISGLIVPIWLRRLSMTLNMKWIFSLEETGSYKSKDIPTQKVTA